MELESARVYEASGNSCTRVAFPDKQFPSLTTPKRLDGHLFQESRLETLESMVETV